MVDTTKEVEREKNYGASFLRISAVVLPTAELYSKEHKRTAVRKDRMQKILLVF